MGMTTETRELATVLEDVRRAKEAREPQRQRVLAAVRATMVRDGSGRLVTIPED